MKKKVFIKYGSISGLVIVGSWFLTFLVWDGDQHFAGSEVIGYAVMILALTAVFMGIKKVRDESGGNSFSFKDGFFTGLGITLVASVIYVVGWMIYMPNFAPDFIDKYEQSQIEIIQSSEVSETEKTEQIAALKQSIEDYEKPHIMMGYTFLEIFPVGLLVTIISALILKRKT